MVLCKLLNLNDKKLHFVYVFLEIFFFLLNRTILYKIIELSYSLFTYLHNNNLLEYICIEIMGYQRIFKIWSWTWLFLFIYQLRNLPLDPWAIDFSQIFWLITIFKPAIFKAYVIGLLFIWVFWWLWCFNFVKCNLIHLIRLYLL